MRRTLLAFGALGAITTLGCHADVEPSVAKPDLAPAAAVAAPPPPRAPRPRTFALSIVGSEANADKRQRCRDQIRALGAHLDAHAPVRATLVLSSQNALKIESTSRGLVLRESLGPWFVADLCREVTHRALAALTRELRDG